MPTTKSYRRLHNWVAARPGAAERLAELRKKTMAEMRLYELDQSSKVPSDCRSPEGRG